MDAYPSAQDLFARGQNITIGDTFSDMFKKDFIEVMAMRARQRLMSLRVDPYPDALLRRGLKRQEARETTNPILEEGMMYTAMMGVELLHRMADIIDMVDRMVL